MITIERWRWVKRACAYGTYEVSSMGRVRSWRSGLARVLSPMWSGRSGCMYASFRPGRVGGVVTRDITVHSAVAEAFLGPRPAGYDIDHIDGDTHNNSVDNLAYCTHQENVQRGWRRGRLSQRGESHGCSKLTEVDVKTIIASSESAITLATRYNVARQHIGRIRSKKTWKHLS